MFVHLTPHSVRRFRERIVDMAWPDIRDEMERQLGSSIDLSGAELRAIRKRHDSHDRLDYWINQASGAVFIVDLEKADEGHIRVVSVLTADMVDDGTRRVLRGTNQKRAGRQPELGNEFSRRYRREKRFEDV